MRIGEFFVPYYEPPVGYLYDRCVLCAEPLHPKASIEQAKRDHMKEHRRRGDVEQYANDAQGPHYRPVVGRPPAKLLAYEGALREFIRG